MFDLVIATILGKITLIMQFIITKTLHVVFFTFLVPKRSHLHAILALNIRGLEL